jgi:hypothetical protein
VGDLVVHAAQIDPPTKQRPTQLTVDGYVAERVDPQIEEYYRRKGRENALRAKKLDAWAFYLGLLAVIMGAMASAAAATGLQWLSYVGPWVAVVTTAGAAVTAHLAASRYDHAAMTYFATADRLTGLRDAWRADPNRLEPARFARFVDECENAISNENEAWLAEWTGEDQDAQAQGRPAPSN